jgi:hypothetical protein
VDSSNEPGTLISTTRVHRALGQSFDPPLSMSLVLLDSGGYVVVVPLPDLHAGQKVTIDEEMRAISSE